MKVQINNTTDLGAMVKLTRQAQGIDQRDMASILGVSVNPVKSLESGRGTVALQTVLNMLNELGIKVELDIPLDIEPKRIDQLLHRVHYE